jgi:EAL domain-containing protein (putative c-di-GMP-specific phosphodiesterase class I)
MGLTDWLNDWVLKTACAQMAAWDRLGLPPLSVSVNISPAQFQFGNLLEKVRSALNVNGLAPQRLKLKFSKPPQSTIRQKYATRWPVCAR